MRKTIAVSPVNIALIKYWGKSDKINITPYNSSISMTLDNLYTKTSIEKSDQGFNFFLNDMEASQKDKNKVYQFLSNFAKNSDIDKVIIRSKNYVPTSAGLASSSSGYSALALCANEYFKSGYSLDELIKITRLGSGSACRSFMGGFVAWDKNNNVFKLNNKYKSFVLISVVISKQEKSISSRDAMDITVNTAYNYLKFVEEGNIMFEEMIRALNDGDIIKVGELTQKSFESLHQIMEESNPKIIYMNDESKKVLKIAKNLFDLGIYVYPTMDAGANVKLLTNEDNYLKIIKSLEENGYLDYYISRLGDGAKIIYE